jgi:hypothetical protein
VTNYHDAIGVPKGSEWATQTSLYLPPLPFAIEDRNAIEGLQTVNHQADHPKGEKP